MPFSSLDELFAAGRPAPAGPAPGAGADDAATDKKAAAKKTVAVIDGKKAYALAITLGRIKVRGRTGKERGGWLTS